MRKIELFTTDGRKIGEFETLATLKEIFDKLPSNIDTKTVTEEVVRLLNNLTDQYFYNEAKKRDYLNMGEIIYDAQAENPDPDAVFLKKLYDAIWEKEEKLEQELQNMTLEELLNLDLQKWAYQQYDQIKESLLHEG